MYDCLLNGYMYSRYRLYHVKNKAAVTANATALAPFDDTMRDSNDLMLPSAITRSRYTFRDQPMVSMATKDKPAASKLHVGSIDKSVMAKADIKNDTKHQLRKVRSLAKNVLGSILQDTVCSGVTDPKRTNFSSSHKLRDGADLRLIGALSSSGTLRSSTPIGDGPRGEAASAGKRFGTTF